MACNEHVSLQLLRRCLDKKIDAPDVEIAASVILEAVFFHIHYNRPEAHTRIVVAGDAVGVRLCETSHYGHRLSRFLLCSFIQPHVAERLLLNSIIILLQLVCVDNKLVVIYTGNRFSVVRATYHDTT